MTNENITEEAYRQLAEDSLEKFNSMNSKVNLLKRELEDTKKIIFMIYGFVRVIDNMVHEADAPPELECLTELARSELSAYIDSIFSGEA